VAFRDAVRRVNPPPQAMLVSESVYLRTKISSRGQPYEANPHEPDISDKSNSCVLSGP
jgi:hypothetical protein